MIRTPSTTAVLTATSLGARAGEECRATGIPQPNPFDKVAVGDLFDVWVRAYVAAAYGTRTAPPTS